MKTSGHRKLSVNTLKRGIASKWFLVAVVALFVAQASWIAVTARYPQAFDEQFHFGVIKLYAHHLLPFWHGQPAQAEQFGAISRDPSYLYQYLMSFPLRLITLVTANQTTQIILLRLLNVGIFAGALLVFAKVLRQLGASRAMSSVVMGFFALTPVVPLLGAQINYDSLMVLMSGLSFSAYLTYRHKLRVQKAWSWHLLWVLLIACLFASLVKYAFLPIAAGLAFAIMWDARYAVQHRILIVSRVKASELRLSSVGYALLIVLGIVLFSERYMVNMVQYHTPIPECDQVLSVSQCQSYAPWARNYMFDGWNLHPTHKEVAHYPARWIHMALGETVFTITSNLNDNGTVEYHGATQLPLPNILSWIMFVGGGTLSILYWRRLRYFAGLGTLLAVGALYVAALFGQNFLDYLHLGLPVAIHGRYLLPILPLLYLAIALSVAQLVRKLSPNDATANRRKYILTAVVLVVFAIEGGGFVTFIVRSNDFWFWPQSRAAQLANQYARDVLEPVVFDP